MVPRSAGDQKSTLVGIPSAAADWQLAGITSSDRSKPSTGSAAGGSVLALDVLAAAAAAAAVLF